MKINDPLYEKAMKAVQESTQFSDEEHQKLDDILERSFRKESKRVQSALLSGIKEIRMTAEEGIETTTTTKEKEVVEGQTGCLLLGLAYAISVLEMRAVLIAEDVDELLKELPPDVVDAVYRPGEDKEYEEEVTENE